MTLIKWKNPSMGLEKTGGLVPSLDNFFNDFFGTDLLQSDRAGFMPSVNITETDTSYQIEASAPGFDKEDFKVQIEDGVLTISGEHKSEKHKSDRSFVRKEFNYGSFSRSFNLADLVDEENIAAKYESGILRLELPKNASKAKKAKQIEIA